MKEAFAESSSKQENQICKPAVNLFNLSAGISLLEVTTVLLSWVQGYPGLRRGHIYPSAPTALNCFTCVDVGVFLHVGFLVEPLAAVLAGIRASVRVDQQVCGQGRGAFECLPTHLALETSLLLTHTHTPNTYTVTCTFKSNLVFQSEGNSLGVLGFRDAVRNV